MTPAMVAAQEQRLRRIAELSAIRYRTGPEDAAIKRLAHLVKIDARRSDGQYREARP